jgi:predicted dehydrogenase
MPHYRIGSIGCGSIAAANAGALLALPDTEIVTGAEVNPENAKKFQEQFNIQKMYTDYREMLENESLDIVCVCTWPRTHCDATVRAARSGVKGILCEKPMAVSLDEADRMITTCDTHGVVLAIGHQHRFSSQSMKARELIDAGEVGRPVLFWGHCGLDLMNNGSHVIDLLNYFNGDEPAEWVMGQIDRRSKREGHHNHPDMPVEDMAVGHVKYRNGVEAVIELGDWGPQEFRFRLMGTDGVIDVNAPGWPEILVLSAKTTGWYAPQIDRSRHGRVAEMRELLDAIEEKREHLSSGRRARSAIEIIMGIFESSRRRALIECPVEVKEFVLEKMIEEGTI